jgi:cytochrome P450
MRERQNETVAIAVEKQRRGQFPLGAAATIDALDHAPHPLLHRLREAEPVSWLPCLGGWLVTRYDLVVTAIRDATTFTVDDPRFSTAQVVGASMLSLDGAEHARHRAPFVAPFRAGRVREQFEAVAYEEACRLVESIAPAGGGDLRRLYAAPMAAAIVTRALGMEHDEVEEVLSWYGSIVASVTSITAGTGATAAGGGAFRGLSRRLRAITSTDRDSLLAVAAGAGDLSHEEVVSNAAVILFGGIETTEGMIATALTYLLGEEGLTREPDWRARAATDPAILDHVIDESLRLEPAAAVIDRYATRDTELGGTAIAAGELVRLSLSAANRDPAVFTSPDQFDPERSDRRRHIAFAQGPHVCVGVHLARLEARAALSTLLTGLPGLRLDPCRPPQITGLVFRKPQRLHALWD